MTYQEQKFVESTVKAIMSRIAVPMDNRPWGGESGGVLLGTRVTDAIKAAAENTLIEQVKEYGIPRPVTSEEIEFERRDRR